MLLPGFVTKWSRIENDAVYCDPLSSWLDAFKRVDAKIVTGWAGMTGRRGQRYKDFYAKYGTTAACVARWINGAQRQLWCHEPYTGLLAYRHYGLRPEWVIKTHKALPLLQQADADGLRHLFPLIAEYGEAPDQLKRRFGKSTWRKLAGNTFSRNMLLAEIGAAAYIDVPSTILRQFLSRGIYQRAELCAVAVNLHDTYKEAAAWLEVHKWTTSPLYVSRHIVRDTIDMAEQLGLRVNLEWSATRWKTEHDRMSKLLHARQYSRDPMVPYHCVQLGQYVAVRLCSAWDIAEEGRTMGHCVASYSKAVSAGEYLVYSLRETMDGPSLATVGVERSPSAWYLEQVQGKYNSPCPVQVDFAPLLAALS